MADVNRTRALKASFSGALDTSASLAAIRQRLEAVDDHADIDASLLEELERLTAAHAVASAALRGLVNAIRGSGAYGLEICSRRKFFLLPDQYFC